MYVAPSHGIPTLLMSLLAVTGIAAVAQLRAPAPKRELFRSAHVFVVRDTFAEPITSLDDPRLRTLRIGIPPSGDADLDTPPDDGLAPFAGYFAPRRLVPLMRTQADLRQVLAGYRVPLVEESAESR
jgi:hypothetical protein